MLQDRLGAATFFFLGNPPYPFTVRDSKESEHNHISAIDVVGGRKTGCRTHPECGTVGRTGKECVECWVTKMNVKILLGSCTTGHW